MDRAPSMARNTTISKRFALRSLRMSSLNTLRGTGQPVGTFEGSAAASRRPSKEGRLPTTESQRKQQTPQTGAGPTQWSNERSDNFMGLLDTWPASRWTAYSRPASCAGPSGISPCCLRRHPACKRGAAARYCTSLVESDPTHQRGPPHPCVTMGMLESLSTPWPWCTNTERAAECSGDLDTTPADQEDGQEGQRERQGHTRGDGAGPQHTGTGGHENVSCRCTNAC